MDNFEFILMAFSAIVGWVAKVILEWFRRDKTESEAEINAAKADKIKSDIVVEALQAMSEMGQDFHAQARMTMDYLRGLDTCKSDIWKLKESNQAQIAENARQLIEITGLKSKIEELMRSKSTQQHEIFELKKSKLTLEGQIRALNTSSQDKDAEIEKLRGRVRALEIVRDDLSKQLDDAKNGELLNKSAQKTVESPLESPKIEVSKAPDA